MIIVDDHLALLAVTGHLPDLDDVGPIATTASFQFRLARALADSAKSGALSRRLADPEAALRRVVKPPAHRLVVLDPRASVADAVRVAVEHRANLLLAELMGAAIYHRASVRVAKANVGKTWGAAMRSAGVDFAAVDI